MKRRALLLAAPSWLALTGSRALLAQTKPVPVIVGWLNTSARGQGETLRAFKEGLAPLGWRDGQDYTLVERWGEGRMERIEALAGEIAQARPAIIVAATSPAVIAAAKSAPNIPIVQANGDPMATGLVKSLARPGGMVTGLSSLSVDITEKLLELLLEAVPNLRRVGILVDASAPTKDAAVHNVKRSLGHRRIEARFAEATQAADLEPAISRLAREGAQALILMPSGWFIAEARRIADLAQARRWPLITGSPVIAESGGLLAYGADRIALYRRAAVYVDKILKGAKPGDLPVEQPTRFELVVNLKAAKTMGITLPKAFLARADRVIE